MSTYLRWATQSPAPALTEAPEILEPRNLGYEEKLVKDAERRFVSKRAYTNSVMIMIKLLIAQKTMYDMS